MNILQPPSQDDKLYPGTVMQVGDDGVARRVPWYKSDTAYGPTGASPIKKRKHPGGTVERTPILKRSERTRAEALAETFVNQLRSMEANLGRPLEPSDLSEQWLRAFGLEFWKAGQPVGIEQMRAVAASYLQAVKRGAGSDPRFTPSP